MIFSYSVLSPIPRRPAEQIRLRNVPFEIIGVLWRKGQTANGSDQDDVILAPYSTVHIRLAGRSFIAQILASVGPRTHALQMDVHL